MLSCVDTVIKTSVQLCFAMLPFNIVKKSLLLVVILKTNKQNADALKSVL